MPHVRNLVAAALGAASLLAAPLAAQIPTPTTITYCPKWASSPLPDATPGKPYAASLGNLVGDAVAVAEWPGAPATPPGLALVGWSVQGTPTTSGSYMIAIQVDLKNPCQGALPVTGNLGIKFRNTAHFGLKVRDIEPPKLTSFTVDQPNVGASGGSVVVAANVTDNVGVQRVMLTVRHPDGHQGSTVMPGPNGQKSGLWQVTIPVAGNSAEVPVSYYFTVSVDDGGGNVARGGPISTRVAVKTAQRVPIPSR